MTKLVLSRAEQIILFALGTNKRYGLEVQSIICNASEGTVLMNMGTLYPTLQRLEDKRMIKTCPDPRPKAERSKHVRKYYELTMKGQSALADLIDFQERLLSWGDVEQ